MTYIVGIADAVWTAGTRTLDVSSPGASNGTYIDDIAYAIWTAGTRNVDETAPVIVLTDHLSVTTGDVEIEVGHAAHFECVSASSINTGTWIQAKIEWSVNDSGSDYRTGIRGFNFSHYFATAGTYTITCTVTNVNGESDTATRTVVVGASTRTTVNVTNGQDLKTVHDANSGADKEFVISGTVTISDEITPGSNNVFRSATPGTQVNVDWTGSGASVFNLSAVDSVTWKDLHFRQGDASLATSVIEFAGTNNNVLDCTVDSGICSGQMLNCSSDPRGVLIQDCDTIHSAGGQAIWCGNSIDSRQLAVYGGTHVASSTNTERAVRGSGLYISFVESYLEQQNAAGNKEALSIATGSYYYYFRTEIINSTASGSGGVLLTGHTSGSAEVTDIVFDRCKMGFTNRVGSWRVGANTSSCDYLMVRNCVTLNTVLFLEHISNGTFHHCTHYNTLTGIHWIQNTAVTIEDMVFTGCLSVWAASPTEAILVNSITDTADEFTLVSNNITGTPSQEDVDINDAVNGNKDEQYVTFNARSNADGNLRKTVAINATTYRPDDLEDVDLLCTPHADLDIFLEDYYGNPRDVGSWIKGAVGAEPEAIPPTGGNQGPLVSLMVSPILSPMVSSIAEGFE